MPILLPLLVSLLMLAPATHAGKADPKNGKGSEAKPAQSPGKDPSDKLAAFVRENLEQALRPLDSRAGVPPKKTSGNRRLTVSRGDSIGGAEMQSKLQAEITEMAEGFKKVGLNLPEPEQAPYARALELCSQFTLILNDRQTRFERYLHARTEQAPTSSDRRETRSDRKQDRREEFDHANRVFERMEQDWLRVSTEYRQIVSNMMDRVRLAEKEVRDAKAEPKAQAGSG